MFRRLGTVFSIAVGVLAGLILVSALKPRSIRIPEKDKIGEDRPVEPTGNLEAKTLPSLRFLIPAYFYPDKTGLESWDRLMKAADRVPITAVVNPSSGPGKELDPNYRALIREAVARKVVVIGYLTTSYGERPVADALADIEQWATLYPEIRGFFFDSQAQEARHVPYYAKLREAALAKIPGAVVVTNPGTSCSEAYFSRPIADLACLFERPEGFPLFHLPDWADHYQPDRFAVMPYGVGDLQVMNEYLARATRGRIGWVYVTDASGDNAWGRLPRYWDQEVEAVSRINRGQEP